jgi:hypothetical protein
MPSFRSAFPSKFIKADDLGATRPIGTIASVDFETVGNGANADRKLVVRFDESTLKPLVLNRINCETIAEITGTDDYAQWVGHRIQLFATKTEFQGKRVACIRIAAPPKGKATATTNNAHVPDQAVPSGQEHDESDIPF